MINSMNLTRRQMTSHLPKIHSILGFSYMDMIWKNSYDCLSVSNLKYPIQISLLKCIYDFILLNFIPFKGKL